MEEIAQDVVLKWTSDKEIAIKMHGGITTGNNILLTDCIKEAILAERSKVEALEKEIGELKDNLKVSMEGAVMTTNELLNLRTELKIVVEALKKIGTLSYESPECYAIIEEVLQRDGVKEVLGITHESIFDGPCPHGKVSYFDCNTCTKSV